MIFSCLGYTWTLFMIFSLVARNRNIVNLYQVTGQVSVRDVLCLSKGNTIDSLYLGPATYFK